MNTTLAIETRQLTRYFDRFCAVDHVDLRVERGMSYGFLGPNGAGKSTTIKMLTGLLAPSEGEVFVLGHNMRDLDESLAAKRKIGVLPEEVPLTNVCKESKSSQGLNSVESATCESQQ